jgi:hypothetical protein
MNFQLEICCSKSSTKCSRLCPVTSRRVHIRYYSLTVDWCINIAASQQILKWYTFYSTYISPCLVSSRIGTRGRSSACSRTPCTDKDADRAARACMPHLIYGLCSPSNPSFACSYSASVANWLVHRCNRTPCYLRTSLSPQPLFEILVLRLVLMGRMLYLILFHVSFFSSSRSLRFQQQTTTFSSQPH